MNEQRTVPESGDYDPPGPGDRAAFERPGGSDGSAQETAELHRLLVQSVRDYAIFMLDAEGRVATWNDGAERIKGYTADEIRGRHFSVFYPADAAAAGQPQRALDTAMATGRYEDEGWRLRKDGSPFWASVVITRLIDTRGRHVGFAKVTRDLSERKQAQEQAIADARRVAEMEAANRAKSEFLATLSHELRTPLNAIGGYTDLLTAGVAGGLTERQAEYLERVRTSQQHMLVLVNDLLNLSRLETGTVDYDIAPFALPEQLRLLEAMIEPQARSRDIAFEIGECPNDLTALADAPRVQQVLLNLLSNAVKFTPSGGVVSLACSVAGARVAISVLDTGPGIPEDQYESIFEPFVQLGRSLTSTREGVGLGLAISRQLARGMGGDLTVSSSVGVGSVFTLLLPRG